MTIRPLPTLATAALALVLAGCQTQNGTLGPNLATGQSAMDHDAMGHDTTPTQAGAYLTHAAASDLFEKESSRLALAKSKRAPIRAYAQEMIADHATTTATLMAQARAAGLMPPTPALMPMQRDMLARLRPLTGDAFDREYVAQQVSAHEMAVRLHGTYSTSGDTPALRTAATAAVPIVTNHLTEAQTLKASM